MAEEGKGLVQEVNDVWDERFDQKPAVGKSRLAQAAASSGVLHRTNLYSSVLRERILPAIEYLRPTSRIRKAKQV